MNKNSEFTSIALAISLSVAAFPSAASAGGFLADTFIRPLSPEAADAADDLNRSLGHPAEQAGAAIMDYYVPGSGRVAQQVWAQNANGGGSRAQGTSSTQIQYGNFCLTQAGRFGPGPSNPIGSFCTANTQWGVVPGQVGF